MSDNQAPDSVKSMGKVMMAAAWVVAIGLLTLFFGNWEKNQYNPNRELASHATGEAAEVTLSANRFHHYVASGEINGRPVTFLLDTGATDVAIPAALAAELGLQPGARGHARTANGIVEVRSTVIEELSLGPIRLHDVRASINPGMGGSEILLGMSALRQVELTQKGDQLTLRQAL